MSLQARLFLGLGAVVVVLLLPGLFAASRLTSLRQLAVEGRSGQAGAVATLGRMQATLAELDRLERSFVATMDGELGAAAVTAANSLRADLERLADSPYGAQATTLQASVHEVGRLAAEIDRHMRRGDTDDATIALGELIERFDGVDRALSGVADSIDAGARRDIVHAQQVSASARAATLAGLAVALVLAVVITAVTARSLTAPLRRLGRAMARVADGSFEGPHDLPRDRPDEIGELMRSFETMAARLAEVDRMKAEFLGMASHELKTPLNVISAYAELIEEGRAEDESERHRSLIAGLTEQAHLMSKLVGRLMDLSRLEAGAFELAPEPVAVEDILTSLKRMFERIASEQGVELRLVRAGSAPETIVVDVDILRDEVLGNLISNALRYTPTGGWIEVLADGGDGGVTFTVTDTGPGVPSEHRGAIFKKHYTVDRTRGVGAGLGLAIAKEMVELHGGLISLEDSPTGCGARFRVALPLAPVSASAGLPGAGLTAAERLRAI